MVMAENESRRLKDLLQADFAVYLKDFFCWLRQNQ